MSELDQARARLKAVRGNMVASPDDIQALLTEETRLKSEVRIKERCIVQCEERIAELETDIEQGFMKGAYARMKNLQEAEYKLADLRFKLQNLIEAIDRVHADPQYQAIWVQAMVHGLNYTGASYGPELDAARATYNAMPKPPKPTVEELLEKFLTEMVPALEAAGVRPEVIAKVRENNPSKSTGVHSCGYGYADEDGSDCPCGDQTRPGHPNGRCERFMDGHTEGHECPCGDP